MNKFTRSEEPHSSVYCLHTAKFLPKSSSEVNTVISMEQSLSTKVETTNASETSSDDEEVNTVFAGKKEHVISMGQSLSTKLETTNGGETNRDDEEVNTTIAGMKEHVISMGRTLSTKLETTNGGETSRDDEEVNTAIPEIEEHAIPMEQSLSTKFETTEAGETSRDNEENEISNERLERNEQAADWESTARKYLRSILDNGDDQPIIKETFRCPKVPPRLRNSERSKDDFDPKIVSFGPYHHGKAELQAPQMIKTKVMHNFISGHRKKIDDLYIKVRLLNDDARSCYVDGSTSAYGDEEFALMMLQDGCFILFFIEFETLISQEYTINNLGPLELKDLYRDMLLLENQIPFFVLKELMSNIYNENEGLTMIKSYLYKIYWGNFQKQDTQDKDEKEPNHLLELLKALISKRRDHHEKITPEKKDMGATRYLRSLGSVSDLQAKGINLKPSNSTSLLSALQKEKSIFLHDVYFRSGFFTGELKLPPLIVGNNIQVYHRNLIAFEMCDNRSDFMVASYIMFMNSLINNPKDVKTLRSKRIILRCPNSDEEIFKMFKDLSSLDCIPECSIYHGVRVEIERHYNSKKKTWIADIRHEYFSHAWSAISLFAAVVGLILTFLQTFYTINPRKA